MHASNHLREAIVGETHEFKKMYQEMIAAAKAEGRKGRREELQFWQGLAGMVRSPARQPKLALSGIRS